MITTFSTDKSTALSGTTAVSNAFIMEFIKDAPAEYIAVYLYALMQYQNRVFENDDIAQALELSEEKVCAAFEYWQRKGILSIIRQTPLHIEFGRTINRPAMYSEGKYSQLIDSLRPILGTRILSATELNKVYDWIEVFGLSEDAVEALFIYCLDTKGSRTSINYMDEVAKSWADNKILTAKDAREYINRNTEYHNKTREIVKRFGQHRNPTEDEVALYRKWVTEYKLSHDVILSACSAMLSATNPSFAYLSTIIEGYKENGAIDAESLSEYNKQRDKLENFCREVFKKAGLTSHPKAEQKERISTWLKELHMPEDVILLLAEFAAQKTQAFSFMCKRIAYWNEIDIRNINDARQDLEKLKSSAPSAVHRGYIKHNYTEEDLAHIGMNFDDD